MNYLILLISLLLTWIPAIAQVSADSTRVSIQIIEEKNNETKVEEHSYHIGFSSPEEQRLHLDSLLNSLSKDGKSKGRRISITLEEGVVENSRPPKTVIRKWDRSTFVPPFSEWEQIPERFLDFERLQQDMDRLQRDLDRFQKQLDTTTLRSTKRLETSMRELMADRENRVAAFQLDWPNRVVKLRSIAGDLGAPLSSKTVRAVSIQPNQPYDGHLNIRFNTNENGDVVIKATDTQGRELGKKTLKNFQGEFVGQIKLKDADPKVLFVSVVQNNDGVTKRVEIRSEDAEK